MKTKSYIAAVLTFVFLAKFFAVDAHGLNIVFSEDDITFVNPLCEKGSFLEDSNEVLNFSQQDIVNSQMVILSGNCTSPFQLELLSWDLVYSNPIAVLHDHFTSRLNYRYLDNVSPPPQLA